MVWGGEDNDDRPTPIRFCPIHSKDYGITANLMMGVNPAALVLRPTYRSFSCGDCGMYVSGRVICDLTRSDSSTVSWCVCSCDRQSPAILIEKDGELTVIPSPHEFKSSSEWPPDLARLFEEASKAYAAGAFTTASMACRKLLMVCACHEGAKENQTFATYVDYITTEIIKFQKAKDSIDQIRSIGNEATHELRFVTQDEAKRSLRIMNYMLDTIYKLPTA